MNTISSDKSLEDQLNLLLDEPVEAAEARALTAFDKQVESSGSRFVLFGAGTIAQRILHRFREDGVQPLAFADNNSSSWGKTLHGLPVMSPADAATQFGRDAVFIVTIYNHRHDFCHTKAQLKALGVTSIMSVMSLRWKYHETFLPYYRDDLPHKLLPQAESIKKAFKLWSDEPSRREYVAQVHWRLHGDFEVLSPPLLGEEYFPVDLFQLNPDDHFVDLGAYDGDTIQKFLQFEQDGFRKVTALEPDPENFARLESYVQTLDPETGSRITCLQKAAGDRACKLSFSSGEGTSSAINPTGGIEVDCVRLDDLLQGETPTYIKMDIEGAEVDAINGCRRILGESMPVVAACVYHAQDHLWRVPLLIDEIKSGYSFFLRPYMPECWETVCYAVPPSRLKS